MAPLLLTEPTVLLTAPLPPAEAAEVLSATAANVPLHVAAVLLSPDRQHVFLDRAAAGWQLPTCPAGSNPPGAAMAVLEDRTTLVRAPVRPVPDVILFDDAAAVALWPFISERDDVCGTGAPGGFFPVLALPRGLPGWIGYGVDLLGAVASGAREAPGP